MESLHPSAPSGTVTFLFTDVEGSTRLWAADEEGMSQSLRVHDSILRRGIQAAGGYVFTTAGDSFAAAFSRSSDAVRAALEIQRELADANWPGPMLKVRMGLNAGEVDERDGDYFGSTVNTAARVEAAAHGGQILATEAVRAMAQVKGIDLVAHRLRDVTEPVHLHQLDEGSHPPLRIAEPRASNLPARPTRLIGRADEIEKVRSMLAAGRLVTLAGTGGAGKTRLALAVGEAELANRPDGVWIVDLSSVKSEAELSEAVAAARRSGAETGTDATWVAMR